ncbi:hypothetical protein BGX26_009726 [Mortierella sp. AD094]|nr:hypothetical protein BGX26_009726 [Mortierella sp. AD094]
MGKKDGMEGGRGSLFSAYLAAMPEPANAPADQDKYLPDSMKASTLLEQIGAERSWSTRDIERDVDILERNRLYTIKDLRVLSPQSWKEIELLPLVKDLLRLSVNPEADKIKLKQDKKKAKKEKKERKKHEKKLKMEKLSLKAKEEKKEKEGEGERSTQKDGGDEATLNEEGLVTIHKSKKGKKSTDDDDKDTSEDESSSSSSSSSSSDSSSSDSDPEMEANTPKLSASQPPLLKTPGNSALLPGPGRIQPMGNRIRVTTGNGTTYEVDRYCPHKHVDLATKGVVVGNTLFCNKHNWAFALDNNGYCSKHRMTINACKVDW